ncbi:MAG: hypothetical protein HFJ59_05515 [Clostridia bacterium]|nr:hypothetical protein [Clostridia bacterium]
MPPKKKNLLEKIVKKDYKNELEEIMDKKRFDENAKSILLSILYKIDIAYKDIEIVKRGIENKEEYLENLIKTIKNECNSIKIVKMSDKQNNIPQNKTYIIDKKKRSITSYPIERKLLYAVSKIGKKENIVKEKYSIINKTLGNLLNIGNNIDLVEPIRDFNGYSWTTIAKEIESINYNLIYQNLRILVGNKFLNKWILNNEFMIDYFEEFKEELEKLYGKQNKFVSYLCAISILLDMECNVEKNELMLEECKYVLKEIEKIKDGEKFVEETTKEKRDLTKKIKLIDTIINDKNLLEKEYAKRNEKLPLEKKIFSMKVLAKKMEKERQNYINKIEKLNEILNPQKFLKYKKELQEKAEYLYVLSNTEPDKEVEEIKYKMQEVFLNMLISKIKKIQTKQEMEKIIYDFRYYILLPYDEKRFIKDIEKLEKSIKKTEELIIDKAIELKMLTKISEDKETNYNILKNIFYIRIIKLEDAYLNLIEEKNENDFKYYIQILDENLFEEKIEIPKPKELNIKPNKKIAIWC